MTVPSLFEQLLSASASAAQAKVERQPWPMNPFPRGIRPGSATEKVLAELQRVAPQSLEAGQLRMRCGISRGALAWAVSYLISAGEIRAVPHHRHPQYLRYSAITGKEPT